MDEWFEPDTKQKRRLNKARLWEEITKEPSNSYNSILRLFVIGIMWTIVGLCILLAITFNVFVFSWLDKTFF